MVGAACARGSPAIDLVLGLAGGDVAPHSHVICFAMRLPPCRQCTTPGLGLCWRSLGTRSKVQLCGQARRSSSTATPRRGAAAGPPGTPPLRLSRAPPPPPGRRGPSCSRRSGRTAGTAGWRRCSRRYAGSCLLDGTQLALPPDAWVDVEAASDAVHRAESALAQGEFAPRVGVRRRWRCSRRRGRSFPGEDAPWLDEERRRLAELHLRALEAYAAATLGAGGTELAAAVRASRELTRLEPYRESGWRHAHAGARRRGQSRRGAPGI